MEEIRGESWTEPLEELVNGWWIKRIPREELPPALEIEVHAKWTSSSGSSGKNYEKGRPIYTVTRVYVLHPKTKKIIKPVFPHVGENAQAHMEDYAMFMSLRSRIRPRCSFRTYVMEIFDNEDK